MLNYFRFRKLNSFLNEAQITSRPSDKVRLNILGRSTIDVFNLTFEEGRRNFAKLVEMIY